MTILRADLENDVVIVEGDDAGEFLHSQLANDVRSLGPGSSAHSLLLEPAGRIHSLLRVVRHGDAVYTLDVENGYGEQVVARLARYVLRSRVTLSTGDWSVRAYRGDGVESALAGVAGAAVVAWGGSGSIDVVGPRGAHPGIGEVATADDVEQMRVDSRWPRLGVDLLQGDIPATSGILPVAVSFTKGCYPGQELVERMDSRGTSAPVMVRCLDRGALVVGSRVLDDGVDVGVVTSTGKSLALARVARDSVVGEPLR